MTDAAASRGRLTPNRLLFPVWAAALVLQAIVFAALIDLGHGPRGDLVRNGFSAAAIGFPVVAAAAIAGMSFGRRWARRLADALSVIAAAGALAGLILIPHDDAFALVGCAIALAATVLAFLLPRAPVFLRRTVAAQPDVPISTRLITMDRLDDLRAVIGALREQAALLPEAERRSRPAAALLVFADHGEQALARGTLTIPSHQQLPDDVRKELRSGRPIDPAFRRLGIQLWALLNGRRLVRPDDYDQAARQTEWLSGFYTGDRDPQGLGIAAELDRISKKLSAGTLTLPLDPDTWPAAFQICPGGAGVPPPPEQEGVRQAVEDMLFYGIA